MAKKKEEFNYICDVNVIFTYMKQEIDFAVKNNLELVTEFLISYKDKKYEISIWNNISEKSQNKEENEINIMLNKERYNSLIDFENNASLNGELIKDIKDNLKITLIYCDSIYLEENQVKSTKTIQKRTFKYEKSYINTLLFCTIFLCIFAIASRWMFKGQPSSIIGYLFFDLIALLNMYCYIYYKNKKIIYKDKSFIVYSIFNKKTYLLNDIVNVTEKPIKGITILFHTKKIEFSPFMNNYNDVKKILKQNNIEIREG